MTVIATDSARRFEVYWIRHSSHSDITSQGYVGITGVGYEKRFTQHKCKARKGSSLKVHNAIRKYAENIVCELILVGSEEYCCFIENSLRPLQGIGWNLSIGGSSTMLGFKHSEETKKKLSVNNPMRGKTLSEDHKKRLNAANPRKHSEEVIKILSEKAKQRIKNNPSAMTDSVKRMAETNRRLNPWENPQADKTIWQKAHLINEVIINNPGCSINFVSKETGITVSKLQVIYRKIKTGWNPSLDDDWQNFMKLEI